MQKRIGDYEVISEIGHGAFSTQFKKREKSEKHKRQKNLRAKNNEQIDDRIKQPDRVSEKRNISVANDESREHRATLRSHSEFRKNQPGFGVRGFARPACLLE